MAALLVAALPFLAPSTSAAQDLAVHDPGDPSVQDPMGAYVTGGEVRFVPLDELLDVPRLPQGRVGQVGEEGDVELSPASGNPYFLGFAAGLYEPPADAPLDPAFAFALGDRDTSGRPHDDTYGFVMFVGRITEERVAALEALGLRILGYHPNNCLRVAIPVTSLESVANLEFVRWVGLARPWQKIHPMMDQVFARDEESHVEVYINVFESDLGPDSVRIAAPGKTEGFSPLDGIQEPFAEAEVGLGGAWMSHNWQQRILESLAVEIRSYSPTIDAFRARMPRARLAEIVALDFVQFVEPWIDPVGLHDESTPLIHADLTRATWHGGVNSAVVAGVVDSGMDIAHSGLNHVWAWGWDMVTPASGAWNDGHGHGSHVSGTVFGRASSNRSLDGVAPGLGSTRSLRIYNVKVLNNNNQWAGADLSLVIERLSNPVTDALGFTTPRPHVVNHSWGASGTWIGTEASCREFDTATYNSHQLHVFAAGNTGSGGNTIWTPGAAKNVFTVGSVVDFNSTDVGLPSALWTSSSRGPLGDLRWKPNVAAPGRWIRSVEASSGTGYVNFSGTSMAAPHVTGLAAQVMDRFDYLRYRPATLGAVLMASALTKGGVTLSAPNTSSTSHHNMYGAGRVEATRALNYSGQALYFWNFTMNSSSGHAELELSIPTGATRATFVMLYHEIAPSAGASAALVNDLDMWLDREPFSPGGNSGNYWSHQSTRDNTELRILNNPVSGNWKIKIHPQSIVPLSGNTVRIGVAALVTSSTLSPATTLATSVDKLYVKPNEEVQMTATVSNPSFIASAVHATTNLGFAGTLLTAETTLKDGHVTNLMPNTHSGLQVTLGNIRAGTNRQVRWRGRWSTQGSKNWTVTVNGENFSTLNGSRTVIVDGTAPSGPTNLTSPTHPVNTSRCNTTVQMTWTGATDNLSGLDGYRVAFDQNPTTVLSQTINLSAAATSYSQTLAPSPNFYYFHIRAVDRSGNWGATQHYGPFRVVPSATLQYCIAAQNSAGPGAVIDGLGSLSVATNSFQLRASGLPTTQPSLFFAGTTAIQVPFGNGWRCVGGTVVRLGVVGTGSGTAILPVNIGPGSPLGTVSPGQNRYFQNWYRDPAAGGVGYNLTNGLNVLFCE